MSKQIEYEKLACRTLELIHPSDRTTYPGIILDLGTFKIIESDHALDAVVERYLGTLKAMAKKVGSDATNKRLELSTRDDPGASYQKLSEAEQEYVKGFGERAVLIFNDFVRFHGNEDSEGKLDLSFAAINADLIRHQARKRFAIMQGSISFSPTRTSYRKYLELVAPRLYEKINGSLPALVPEEPRRRHSYMVGTTGTGKSELLKALVLNYVQNPDYCGLVMLDPGGDMVEQIARWPELIPSGRLVYVDPTLDRTLVPVINPFDADHLDDRQRAVLSTQIVKAIGALVEGKLGGSISVNMEAVLYPAVRLLVDIPNSSIKDLRYPSGLPALTMIASVR